MLWINPMDADARGIKNGVDTGGNVNTIMKYHPSPPAKGNPGHTALVQVEKHG